MERITAVGHLVDMQKAYEDTIIQLRKENKQLSSMVDWLANQLLYCSTGRPRHEQCRYLDYNCLGSCESDSVTKETWIEKARKATCKNIGL